MNNPDTPRDEALSRLYAAVATEEPPPALDAAILAAARAEASHSRTTRSRPGWQRWMVPVSLAVVVVASLALTLLVPREMEQAESERMPAPAAVQSGPLPHSPQPSANRPSSAPAAPAPIRSRRKENLAAPPAPEGESAAYPSAAAGPKADKIERRDAFVRDAAPAGAASPPPAQGVGDAAGSLAPLGSPGKGAAERMEQTARLPQDWLHEVRALLRQGREREAREAFAAFHRAYPGYALPPDLRDLGP
jgi:hypothetical protein